MIPVVYWEPTKKTYPVERDRVLLQSLLQKGAPVEFECQFGHCRKCIVHLKEGFVRHEDSQGITEEEKKQGFILLCSAKPCSETLSLAPLKND